MDVVASQDEQALCARLERARERLDALVTDLRAVDGELEELSIERKRYRLLHDVCGALDELRELGAAGLFWGERVAEAENHVGRARERATAFQKGLDEIEDRRQAILEELELAQGDAEIAEEDAFEAQQQAELRKLEWVIERDVDLPFYPSVMPWTRGGEDDERFWKSLGLALLLSLSFGLVFPMIPLPSTELWEAIELPDRLTRLVQEQRPLPPPPVRETKPTEPEPTKELLAEAPAPKSSPEQAPKPSAESKGILAFREKFSALADNEPATRLGAQARISNPGEVASGRPQRAMVTTQAAGSSGGINLAALSRDVGGGGGGGGIEGVQVARATSSIGAGSGADRPLSDGPGLSRTDEEIQIVFDRHKAALYRLYNRELRNVPTLKGQMVLRLTIEPDGSVSLCQLQSTDMDAPQLSAQVVERVRTFDFGAKDGIPSITILYPIDFLPAI